MTAAAAGMLRNRISKLNTTIALYELILAEKRDALVVTTAIGIQYSDLERHFEQQTRVDRSGFVDEKKFKAYLKNSEAFVAERNKVVGLLKRWQKTQGVKQE